MRKLIRERMTIDDLTKRKSDLDYYVREFDTFRNSLNAKLGSLNYYIAGRTDPVARNLYGCLRYRSDDCLFDGCDTRNTKERRL